MKNTLYEQWMSDYLYNENSIANENLRKAVIVHGNKMNPIETVRAMYTDKLFDEKQCMHAYSESGNIGISVLLHRITVKELFPIPHQKDFEQLLGMPLEMLEWCIREGFILPIIQHPIQYRNIEYIHRILMDYSPACYEIRDKLIYGYLSAGKYSEYVEHGLRNKAIAVNQAFLKGNEYKEEYELFLGMSDKQRWDQRNAQRYAALASLVGEQVLIDALELEQNPPITKENIKKVQNLFFAMHRKVLHPLTQGLGGLPYNVLSQPYYNDTRMINKRLENELFQAIGKSIPNQPTKHMIEKLQETDIPDRFSEVETSLLRIASEEKIPGKNIEESVVSLMDELTDESKRIDSKAKMIKVLLSVTGVGAAIACAEQQPQASVAVSALVPMAADNVVNKIFNVISHVYGKKYLPWQYWRFTNDLKKLL